MLVPFELLAIASAAIALLSIDNARLRWQCRQFTARLVNSVPVDWDVNVLESGMVLPVPTDERWVFSGFELSIGEVRVHLTDRRLRIGGLLRDGDRALAYAIAVIEGYQQRRALAAIEGTP